MQEVYNRVMKKKMKPMLLALFLALSFSWYLYGQSLILPIEQIKTGMKGKGRSVFIDDKIEEFDVEILGVIRDFQPKKNLILAKLKGNIVDQAGVIQGMSGSPVYIDGKLIGAISYSIADFPKEALVGITPIGEMLVIEKEKAEKSTFSLSVPVKKYLSMEDLFEINKNIFQSRSATFVKGQAFTQLNIPLVISGFSSHVFEETRPFFEKLGFNPVRTGSSVQTSKELSLPDITLRSGDPVAVQLVTGDVNMSAIGTVTYVDGNKVLAFGHPLYNLGAVDYAMTKAKVIAVAPSLSSSFKIASPYALVGRFSQDRNSGVFGELGKMPKLLPINIKVLKASNEVRDFSAKVVSDKILTPFLVNAVVANIMSVEERALGDLSLQLDGNIYLDNGMNVHLEDLFSGNFDSSVSNISNLVAAVVFFLTNNEFKDLGIHRIDLNIQSTEEVKFSYLEKVWLDKYDLSPGETIQVSIYTRNFRGESVVEKGYIAAPLLPSGSEFHLIIADAQSMHLLESSQYKSQALIPRSLSQLIRMLNSLRKNNRIYLKIIASKPGLFLRGEEMPNLPPTMKSMFSSARAATSAPTELSKSTLSYYQHPVPYVFKGAAVIPLKIK